MQAILKYLQNQGYGTVDESYYSYIRNWFAWYKGKVQKFHTYRQYNGMRRVCRERKSLGMAKKVAEDWANLELNEKVTIAVDNKILDEKLRNVLDKNNFWVRGNQLIEMAYALGTGAIVEYLEKEGIKMDFIRAGMIYPLSWDNGEISECAFGSERTNGKQKLVYLNIHRKDESGNYVIENKMFIRNKDVLTPTELPPNIEEVVQTNSSTKLFQIIKPNIANNFEPDCPMGISVFANAIDILEGIDLVYDSYCNEFRLGKKRLIVPMTMAKVQMQEDGTIKPLFDDNDTEFFAYETGAGNNAEKAQTLQEINMELRAEAHEQAIKTMLGLLSAKCGLGNDRFNFERGNLKTATEVISDKSELYQNLKKHEIILEKSIKDMVRAIASLSNMKGDFKIEVNFDDSIIVDAEAERQRFMQEIRDGLRQKYEYRMEYLGESEEEAKAKVQAEEIGFPVEE